MAQINLGYRKEQVYGCNVNILKKYDTYIFVALALNKGEESPVDIVATTFYGEMDDAIIQESFHLLADEVVVLRVKPFDPRCIVDDVQHGEFVWVVPDVAYVNGFKKCSTVKEATVFIEHLLHDEQDKYEIDDFIVLIGYESYTKVYNGDYEEYQIGNV